MLFGQADRQLRLTVLRLHQARPFWFWMQICPLRADGSGQDKKFHGSEPKRQRCRYLAILARTFAMSDDDSESAQQRIGRFRRLAAKARESAAKSSTVQARNEFLKIAGSREDMADAAMNDAGE